MTFSPVDPDFERSPFTGMTWKHWVQAGEMLLDGVFRHIPSLDSPLRLPRHETAVSYPQPGHPEWKSRSEIFEGVARTLLIAGPLLAHFPEMAIRNLPLGDYYRRAILRLTDPASPEFVGDIKGIVAESGDNPYQMTCECASLAIALKTAPAVLWEPFSQAERDQVARVLGAWAHRRTHPHNWRLFNILIMAFLKEHGYGVDQDCYEDHLRVVRSFDAGDGWYRDGTLFDYYSVWAFQFYAPLWAGWSGYRELPAMAAAIEASSDTLLSSYDRIFDRNGHQAMWGRSNIYRCAASAPFGSAFYLENPGIRPGVARRVMSGNLLQFIGHPEFWQNGLPSLGFYGPFAPLIQPYSCAASPFWFGNTYQAVAFGPEHPLWTATEEEGSWAAVPAGAAVETELPGPGMVVTQYGPSGCSEIRTGKVMIAPDSKLLPHYSRLSFNTAFPWQDDTSDRVSSMHYNLWTGETKCRPNLLLYSGLRTGVLYRRLVHDFEGAFGDRPVIDLADWALPDGLVRCDRIRITDPEYRLQLAHYALPVVDGACQVTERKPADGIRAITVSSGRRRLALVVARGWQELSSHRDNGLHPETRESLLLSTTSRHSGRYSGAPLRISLLLHRIDAEDWSDEELWPFTDLRIHAIGPTGSAPFVEFMLRDGQERTVDFSGVEGRLLL